MTRIGGWADTWKGWALVEDLPKMGCGQLDMRIRYVRSVESSALVPLLFSMAHPIVQNANQKHCRGLFIQPDSGDRN